MSKTPCQIVFDTMTKIQATNSMKDHAVILHDLSEIELTIMTKFFLVALDESRPTNIGKLDKKASATVSKKLDCAFTEFEQLAENLMSQKSANDNDKIGVANFLKAHAESPAVDLYQKAILRKSIGIGSTVINEVWKERTGSCLLSDFEVMLAPNKQPDIKEVQYPLNVQPKLDGFRAVLTPQGFFSRNGKPFANITLRETTTGNADYVFDGELYYHGENFSTNVGHLTRQDSVLPAGLAFVVFDVIPVENFENHTSPKMGYKERLTLLDMLVQKGEVAYGIPVQIIENHVANSYREVQELYDHFLDEGYEGVMLKSDSGKYKFGRCTLKENILMKFKPVETFDLKIIGFELGEKGTKKENTLGTLLVEYKDKQVGVASGLDDKLCDEIWNNQDDYLGKHIEVKTQGETEKGSLRFPVFVRFRPDKDVLIGKTEKLEEFFERGEGK